MDRAAFIDFAQLSLAQGFDRLESCCPPCVHPSETTERTLANGDNHLRGFGHGAIETSAAILAALFYKVAGEGIAICDAAAVLGLEPLAVAMVRKRLAEESGLPDFRLLAVKFADFSYAKSRDRVERWQQEMLTDGRRLMDMIRDQFPKLPAHAESLLDATDALNGVCAEIAHAYNCATHRHNCAIRGESEPDCTTNCPKRLVEKFLVATEE